MTEASPPALPMFQELLYTPALLNGIPRPRSPCWYQGELWILAGWRVHAGRAAEGNHEPVARYDGKRWRFYPQPLSDPEMMVCDGHGLLVVDQTARGAKAYYSEAGHAWQPAPMPPSTPGHAHQEWRFAGGGAIVAYSPREIWQWKERAWQPVPWQPPQDASVLARVIPEESGRWFVVTAGALESDWQASYGHLSPAAQPKQAQAEARKMMRSLEQVWDLIKADQLPQARAALVPLLARYPHDSQILFCQERLLWREQNSPQAAMARIEQALTHAQGRFGRARLYNLYGNTLDELGQHQAALPWFERAANEFPDPIYYANLAEIHEKLGGKALAIRWAHRALVAGSDSKLCLRILEAHGVARPSAEKDTGYYLWTIAIHKLDRSAGSVHKAVLTPLETRTLRLDYGAGDGPFHESPGATLKALPRYLLPTGIGVWPDDANEAVDLRAGPVYSANHVYRWRDRRGSKVNPESSAQARGTVFVHRQTFEIRHPTAVAQTIAYVPFALSLGQDDRLDSPDLATVHVVDSQVYFPYYDAASNITRIMRFKFDTEGHSEPLGSLPGQARPFFIDGQPVWLLSEPLHNNPLAKSRSESYRVSLYSLDGNERITDGPQLAAGETLHAIPETRGTFLWSARGVYRFHAGAWTLFSYAQLGVPVVNLPLPSGKPGRDFLQGRPLMLAGHTLWIRKHDGTFFSVDLDRPAAGTRAYTPGNVHTLAQMTAPWTAGMVDEDKLYLASDEQLTVVQLPAQWGGLKFVAKDVVQTRDIGLVRLR